METGDFLQQTETNNHHEQAYTLQQLLTPEFIDMFTQFGSFEAFLERTQLARHEVVEPHRLSFMKRLKVNVYIRRHSMFQSLAQLLHLACEYKVKKDRLDRLYNRTNI